MASGKSSRSARKSRPPAVRVKSTPWGTIAAVAVVVVFAASVLGYAVFQGNQKKDREDALATFTPSPTLQDPSTNIPGVVRQTYTETARRHVQANQTVAYTHSPPFGGSHDFTWAACTGVVYPTAVRNENMVHSLEHGAVWIAYDPARVTGEAVGLLAQRAQGKPYTMMSPYPGLDSPISLQSWGHQLKLSDVNDPRIDQFIQALRRNQYAYPEIGASCDSLGAGTFDQDNPPPYRAAPPASQVDDTRVVAETSSTPQLNQPEPGAPAVPGTNK
jgi:hypothetical protein